MKHLLFLEVTQNGRMLEKTLWVCEKTSRVFKLIVTLYRSSPFLCKVFLRCLILFIKKHYQCSFWGEQRIQPCEITRISASAQQLRWMRSDQRSWIRPLRGSIHLNLSLDDEIFQKIFFHHKNIFFRGIFYFFINYIVQAITTQNMST